LKKINEKMWSYRMILLLLRKLQDLMKILWKLLTRITI
jgi:hypothetical protein